MAPQARGPPAAPPPAPGRRIWGVPARLDGSVDREALLGRMTAALRGGGPVWLAPHADRPGLGTTSALVDFAHRYRDRYDVAWWVPALDPDLVPDRLAELAAALGLTGGAEPADRATTILLDDLARRGRWLLVFDDAPGPRELGPYLPVGAGHVLVASTDPGWREHATPVTVPVFTRTESVALLRAGRPDLPPGQADGVAHAVGDVPSAVAHASALLADPGMDVGSLHGLLPRTHDRADPEVTRVLGTVRLDRLAPEPGALALLTLAAWSGPAALPLSVVAEHRHVLPEPLRSVPGRPVLHEYAAALCRRGLARAAADGVLLHPQTARLLVCRSGRSHAGDGGWAAAVIRLLRAAAPDLPAQDPAGWPTWRVLLPHVLAATDPARPLDPVADEVSWLLAGAGGYLAACGRPDAARSLLDDAQALRPDRLDPAGPGAVPSGCTGTCSGVDGGEAGAAR